MTADENKCKFTEEELTFILEGKEPLEQLECLVARYKELYPKRHLGISVRSELLTMRWKMKDIIDML